MAPMAESGRPSKRTKLLSDSEDSDDEVQQGVKLSNGHTKSDPAALKINADFAKRFEHNKKREEKHRLEEKYEKKAPGKKRKANDEEQDEEDESSTDEDEDDEADLITADLDQEIMSTLQAIKNKDPRVYDANVKFYREFDPEAIATITSAGKKEKPMTLQDYHRQNLMKGYTGDEDAGATDVLPRTYNEEQDALRREMVGQMHALADGAEKDEESEEDDFKPKAKGTHESLPAAKTRKITKITETDIAAADKDPETFLSNFMAAQAWRSNNDARTHTLDSDDSEEDARAEAFEAAYNMRFEDPALANEKLKSFARDVGKYSVRRDEATGRKKAREREREQKDAAKRERDEERARLRKLKIDEVEEKVKRIKEAAGLRGKDVNLDQWRDVIDGDFDDDAWDKEMTRRFGDEYYADQEGIEDSDVETEDGDSKKRKPKKPQWDDDIDIDDLVPDFEKEPKPKVALTSDEEDDGGAPLADADEDEPAGKKRKTKKDREKERSDAKRAARKERQKIEEMVDAALPLSHPTIATSAGSSKAPVTGFRYRETSPTTFGLSARDILFADDTQLNNFAGLKKMAAFRDEEKKQRDKKKFSKKGRLRQWRKEVFGTTDEPTGGFERILGGKGAEPDDAPGEESNVKDGARKKKRSKKRKAKEVKA